MKDKLLAALLAAYKNLGFSDKAIQGVLAYLEATVKEESEIEGAIKAVEPMLKAFQSEVDTRVNTAVTKAKAEGGKKEEEPKKEEPLGGPTQQQQQAPADTPEWAKGLFTTVNALSTSMQTLAGTVNGIVSGKATDTRKSQLETALKDAPEAYKQTVLKAFPRMNFEKDEDFTNYMSELTEDLKSVVQDTANNGLAQFKKPTVPTGGGDVKKASKEESDTVVNSIM